MIYGHNIIIVIDCEAIGNEPCRIVIDLKGTDGRQGAKVMTLCAGVSYKESGKDRAQPYFASFCRIRFLESCCMFLYI